MIIFGTPEQYYRLQSKIDIVFNFNSLVEGCATLDALNPYWQSSTQLFKNDMQFDIWYIEYLTTTNEAFKQIIDVLRIVYNGFNVYILCDFSNEVSVNMIECLVKFITDTYGYICNIVKTEYDEVKEGSFSSQGIQLFDTNMETYIKLFGVKGLQSQHGDLA